MTLDVAGHNGRWEIGILIYANWYHSGMTYGVQGGHSDLKKLILSSSAGYAFI